MIVSGSVCLCVCVYICCGCITSSSSIGVVVVVECVCMFSLEIALFNQRPAESFVNDALLMRGAKE